MSFGSGRVMTHLIKPLKYQTGSRAFRISRPCSETFTTSDAIMPSPRKTRITTFIGASVAVTAGVLTGAHMSKNIASFLEENELFVPSEDDDDD